MNPVAILDSLDPQAITKRLDELRGEQQALRTLLRAARQRAKGQDQREQAVREALTANPPPVQQTTEPQVTK